MLISQYTIDTLLQSLDLYEIVSHQVRLKKVGATYRGLCPFHNEKTPSFHVNPRQQTYHCYGCGAHGNVITFYKNVHYLEFPEAVEELAQSIGLTVEYQDGTQPPSFKDLHALLQTATALYQQQLTQSPQAFDYLLQRGLSPDIIQRYQLGFAPDSWDVVLKALGNSQQLLDVGLIREKEATGTRYDRFRNRIMFPIHDARGRVIAFGGRVLDNSKPKYLNSPETALFQKSHELYGWHLVRQQKHLQRVIVVEGYIDVIALANCGIHNVVATLGTAISREHLKRIFRLVPEVTFCFDGDAAGRKAAHRALLTLLPLMLDGYQVKFVFLPEGDDPDSYVNQYGKVQFLNYLNHAILLSQFLFETYLFQGSQHQANRTAEGIARLKMIADKELIPLINQMPRTQFKQSLLNELQEITTSFGIKQRYSEYHTLPSVHPLPLIDKAVQCLLQYPEMAADIIELPVNTPETALLLQLFTFIDNNPDANPAVVQANFSNVKVLNITLIDDTEFSHIIDRIRVNQRKLYLTQRIQVGIASDNELHEFQRLVLTNIYG